jgi:PBSX family phage portal protein
VSKSGTQTRRVLGAVEVDRGDSNASVAEVHKRNLRAVKATIYGITKGKLKKQEDSARTAEPAPTGAGTSSGQAKGREVDTFARLERAGKIVKPPFDPLLLAVMPENSTELGPAIDAMAVNCEAFGWRLEPRIPINEMTPLEVLQDLAEEAARAENFFASCCADDSFEDLREKARRDFEATGMFYTEFLEVPGTGELDGLNHLPAWTMRLGRLDKELTEYIERVVEKKVRLVEIEEPEPETPAEAPGLDGAPDLPEPEAPAEVEEGRSENPVRKQRFRTEVTYELVEHRRFKRFRRYVQKHEGRTTYFKEVGDPRIVDSRKGDAVGRDALVEDHGDGAREEPRFTLAGNDIVIRTGTTGFPVRWAANTVKHLDLYSTRSSYGLPRYIGNLFSIFGSRAADEVNYVTFKNQNIPNLAITISNGQLTDETGERIEEFLEAIQSDDNYSKILVLEAEPVMEGMRDPGTVKIELHPLGKEQHTDAMFVKYQQNNDERTRRAWRFPPIFVGKSEDFTGKTIDASRKLADEQVFGPERNRFDRFWTRWVLLRLGVVWSTFKANSPNVTENADLVRLLAQGEKTGGLTPRISRQLIGRVVNEDLGDVDADLVPPDQPFSLTLAQLMKSTSATDAAGGGEPTSQGGAGLQVGDSERDRDLEAGSFEEDQVDRLQAMLREEVASRFGGFVPAAFLDDFEEDDA